jgi:hypothetical protein
MNGVGAYFSTLGERVGAAWNCFWFTPSDPFNLCVIRILTGGLALALYLTYIPDLEQLFGPNGLLSENAVLHLRGSTKVFSIFDYANSPSSLWFFFWTGAAALALFTIGLFTRVTAVLALVMLLSLIHRGPALARPVDDIIAMVMFYLCLGPCGAALSVDAWLHRRKQLPGRLASPPLSWTATVSNRLIQLHLSAIYFLMAVAKLKSPVWWSGMAVWGLLAKPESRLIDLPWLADPKWIYILNAWTLAIVLFELAFSLLIWIKIARPLLLGLAVPLWISTALLTGMTSWAAMMLVANLAFASPTFLRRCLSRNSLSAAVIPPGR